MISSYLHIKGLLNNHEVNTVLTLISQSQFADGKTTASSAAASVKRNLQSPKNGSMEAQQISNIIIGALSRNSIIQSAVLPKMLLPPIISKYEVGMEYGMHVDSPLMGEEYTIRTDVGMTVFLSDPSTYEGGELSILSEVGEVCYKLPLGDAIIYPTTKLHRVLPVTSGTRLAAVTWMQSAVRDPHKREILYNLNLAVEALQKNGLNDGLLAVQQSYSNLLRMWAEL